ncbi:MAG: hypothetical protein P1P85_03845 [Patescibacteria group bacterium]|nr:hypothetical protein [Patescibacteria group bacterium]
MDWYFVGFVFESIGEILLGIMIIVVHRHVLREHKIDEDVLKQMKREQVIGILAVVLMAMGFLLQMFFNY